MKNLTMLDQRAYIIEKSSRIKVISKSNRNRNTYINWCVYNTTIFCIPERSLLAIVLKNILLCINRIQYDSLIFAYFYFLCHASPKFQNGSFSYVVRQSIDYSIKTYNLHSSIFSLNPKFLWISEKCQNSFFEKLHYFYDFVRLCQ